MVFTIPKRLRVFLRYDRRLLRELAGCAWRALSLYFRAHFDNADVTAGAVRLGRYMTRCPIVLKRLSWEAETAEVVYRGRPSRRAGLDSGAARWDVLAFLARVVDHIAEPAQQTVRYWGFCANAARGKRRKDAQGEDAAEAPARRDDDDEFTRRARLSWAKLIRRVCEVEPLLSPFFGSEMKILAFLVDFGAAKAVRESPRRPI